MDVIESYKAELQKLIEQHPYSYFNILKSNKPDKQKYKQIYDFIKNKYKNILQGRSIPEYCYWFLHDLTEFPECENPKCDHSKPIKFINVQDGYAKHCSVKCLNQNPNHNKTIYESKLKKYGNGTYNNIDKNRQTVKERYGKESVFQVDKIKDKIYQTKTNKYGNPKYVNRDKANQTFYEKYNMSLTEYMCKQHKKYFYDGKYFDSSWELCYYIYLTENKINFVYPANVKLTYLDSRGIAHAYYPDFVVDGKLVEIKGNQFIDEDGSLTLPYRYDSWTDEEYEIAKDIYKSKYKCMIDNNVTILSNVELNEILSSVKDDLDQYLINKVHIPDEYFGWTQDELVELCLNNEFPGSHKYPAGHFIWKCNVNGKLSPYEGWKNKDILSEAVKNLFWILAKSEYVGPKLNLEFAERIRNIFEAKETEKILRLILERFTIARIAPKVTALQPSLVLKILEDNNIDISRGVYCPMAGFGGIIEGSKRWFKARNIDCRGKIEAYDINENLCQIYGWEKRDILAQKIQTDKIVIACPPFGLTEQWPGTDKQNYYEFEEWCRLIKRFISAPKYVFIGPEKTEDKETNNKMRYKNSEKPANLFRKKVQAVYRQDVC